MDNQKEEVRKVIIEFFEQKGGYRRVAEQTGMNTQTLYNIVAGRNAPTLEIVLTLAKHFPDFALPGLNIDKPETTEPTAPARPELPPPPTVNVERVLHDLDRERREREELQRRYNNLLDRHEKLVDVFLKEKAGVELSFLLVSSETPTISLKPKHTPSRFRPQVRNSRAVQQFPVRMR